MKIWINSYIYVLLGYNHFYMPELQRRFNYTAVEVGDMNKVLYDIALHIYNYWYNPDSDLANLCQ